MQKAGEPLRKITLNLYERDVETLYKRFGWGWSEIVRGWVRQHLNKDYRDEDDRRTDGYGSG